MKEVDNLLNILQETKRAIQDNDSVKIKELSDHTLHTSSLSQDEDNIILAVIVYSLSKIVERKEYQDYPGWKDFYRTIMGAIDKSIISLKKDDEEGFKENLGLITRTINRLSGKLKTYIQDVFRKARINKAAKIYEHGISMEKTAHLLGISLFELANYAGQRGEASEAPLTQTMDVKSRIKIAMDMFK
jgi:hypothetical protein